MSTDDLKKQGNEAAKAGDFQKAIECFSQAISIDPTNHILFSNRSNIYHQMGNFNAALADAEECIKVNPAFGKGYVRKADALLKLDKKQEAMSVLEEGNKVDPNEKLISDRMQSLQTDAVGDMMSNAFGRSENELRTKMMSNPKTAAMMARDPSLFARMNMVRQNPNAMGQMQQDPAIMNCMMHLMGLGDMMEQAQANKQENPQQGCAGNCGDQCCKKTGGPCCSEQKGQQQPAASVQPKKEEKHQSKEEQEADDLKVQGNELFKKGQYSEAISKYELAFEKFKNITYLNNVSTCLIKQEKFGDALAKAEEAYQYGRDNVGSASFQELAKALFRQGSALHKLGRLEEAITKLNESMTENRDKQTLQLLNQIKQENEQQKKIQSFDVEAALACKNAGAEFYKSQKMIEAAEKFTEGLKFLPLDLLDSKPEGKAIYIQLLNNRSQALFKAGQIHPSYDDSMTILKLEPNNIKCLLRKATIERLRKQYYLSVETYNMVFTLDQTNAEALEGFQKTMQKIQAMQSGSLSEEEMKEIQEIAMKDESIQNMMKDPGLSQVLQQMQANPAQAQKLMSDPSVAYRIQRLINAGVLRVGGK